MPLAPTPTPGGRNYGTPQPDLSPGQRQAIRDLLNHMKEEDAVKWLQMLQDRNSVRPNGVDPETWYSHSWIFSNGPTGSPGFDQIIKDAHDAFEKHLQEWEKEQQRAAAPPSMAPPSATPNSPAPAPPPVADHGAIHAQPAGDVHGSVVAMAKFAQHFAQALGVHPVAAPGVHADQQI